MGRDQCVLSRTAAAVLLVLAAAGPCGCGQKPDDALEQADKSLRSWAAAVRLTAAQWSDGRVPALYLRQTLEAADESLGQQETSLRKANSNDGRCRQLAERIAAVRNRIREMTGSADRSDHPSVAASVHWVEAKAAEGPARGGSRS